MKKNISLAVVRRLPRYYRYLGELRQAGTTKISSKELSKRMRLTASQIRQDLNCFGGFGQQGYGYNVELLHGEIATILGLKSGYSAILIGAGNLGRAISQHMAREKLGFTLVGIFDVNKALIGKEFAGHLVMPMDQLVSFCGREGPESAILTVPAEFAAEVAAQLKSCGIKGIWNFSNTDIHMQAGDVPVENVHLADSLMTLCYRIQDAGARKREDS